MSKAAARHLLTKRHKVMMNPLEDDLEQTPSQTSDVEELGIVEREDDSEFGKSDGLDPEAVGDIADEGTGHRG